MLQRLDYLSTVSGGGYIGGWLAAWIKREGEIKNVEDQLHPNRKEQANAKRWGVPIHHVVNDEPEPIRHLRAFSDYLAPRPGLFSADGWVLLVIYLRNFLLNQVVLLFALVGMLYGATIGVKCLARVAEYNHQVRIVPHSPWTKVSDSPWVPAAAAGMVCLGFLLTACGFIAVALHRVVQASKGALVDPRSIPTRRVHLRWGILGPLLAAAVAASVLATSPWVGDTGYVWEAAAYFACLFGALHGLFSGGPLARQMKTSGWAQGLLRWTQITILACAPGVFAGLLFYTVLARLHTVTHQTFSAPHPSDCLFVSGIAVFGPPLFLVVFVLTGFVHVGLQGGFLDEAQREWWSSLASWVLMYATAWAAVFGTILFGPYLVLIYLQDQSWRKELILALVIGWLFLVYLGVAAAQSPGTRNSSLFPGWSGVVGISARLAPGVFLVGLLVFAALTTDSITHYLRHGGEWVSAGQYLMLLNDPEVGCWKIVAFPLFLVTAILAGRFVDVNIFSLQGMYANRLIRCYLGASRKKKARNTNRPLGAPPNSYGPPRDPNVITGFDPLDDMALADLQINEALSEEQLEETKLLPDTYRGPLVLINTALNLLRVEDLAWKDRKAESFVLSARYCGCPTTRYRPTNEYGGGVNLGVALAVSGAAVSPNMGYHSSPSVTALLSLFNARLGAWFGNPNGPRWSDKGPRSIIPFLVTELLGYTDDHHGYVYLSDGGHFDNLGVYELIRRRCRFIIVCDAGADPGLSFEDLGNLIRKVRIDFGVRIEIDVGSLRPGPDGRASSHVAVGKVLYGDIDHQQASPSAAGKREPGSAPGEDLDTTFNYGADDGVLIYLKPVLTGDEPADIDNYAARHPQFPHDPTVNQFFTESQFESYRELGYHSGSSLLLPISRASPSTDRSNSALFLKLFDYFFPPPPDFTSTFMEANRAYIAIVKTLRNDPRLRRLSAEAHERVPAEHVSGDNEGPPDQGAAERNMVAQMLTVMENVWFSLHLERYRQHPAHTGWIEVFRRWWGAPTVRAHWNELKDEFNHGFRDFLEHELPELPIPAELDPHTPHGQSLTKRDGKGALEDLPELPS
jgi:hypothetical protein